MEYGINEHFELLTQPFQVSNAISSVTYNFFGSFTQSTKLLPMTVILYV